MGSNALAFFSGMTKTIKEIKDDAASKLYHKTAFGMLADESKDETNLRDESQTKKESDDNLGKNHGHFKFSKVTRSSSIADIQNIDKNFKEDLDIKKEAKAGKKPAKVKPQVKAQTTVFKNAPIKDQAVH